MQGINVFEAGESHLLQISHEVNDNFTMLGNGCSLQSLAEVFQ